MALRVADLALHAGFVNKGQTSSPICCQLGPALHIQERVFVTHHKLIPLKVSTMPPPPHTHTNSCRCYHCSGPATDQGAFLSAVANLTTPHPKTRMRQIVTPQTLTLTPPSSTPHPPTHPPHPPHTTPPSQAPSWPSRVDQGACISCRQPDHGSWLCAGRPTPGAALQQLAPAVHHAQVCTGGHVSTRTAAPLLEAPPHC